MIEIVLHQSRSELAQARRAVRNALSSEGMHRAHTADVVAVVDELVAAARECEVTTPLVLTIVPFARLTSVRVTCDRDVELRDKPFEIRERLLQHLALAFGRRPRPDGTVDLWAEVVRPA